MRNRKLWVALFVSAILMGAIVGCGGNPAGPSGGGNGGSTAVVITVLDGLTDAPVVGATVTFAGQTKPTDAAGKATFDGAPQTRMPIDVVAGGYLPYQQFATGSTTHYPWPVRGQMTEAFIQELNYKRPGDPLQRIFSMSRLLRPVYVELDPQISATGSDTWRSICAVVSRDLGHTFSIDPMQGTFAKFSIVVEPGLDATARTSAFGEPTTGIEGGTIQFVSVGAAHVEKTIRHELWHAEGMGHQSLYPGLMNVQRGQWTFEPNEAELNNMSMRLRREPENRWPDCHRDRQDCQQ